MPVWPKHISWSPAGRLPAAWFWTVVSVAALAARSLGCRLSSRTALQHSAKRRLRARALILTRADNWSVSTEREGERERKEKEPTVAAGWIGLWSQYQLVIIMHGIKDGYR